MASPSIACAASPATIRKIRRSICLAARSLPAASGQPRWWGRGWRMKPKRDPSNPNYPRATEFADGNLPPAGAEGNFIIGPTHAPAPETIAKDGVPRGTTTSFTLSSKDSVIYNPGLIRDDVAGCSNSSIMVTTTAPGDKSNMVVATSHPGTWTRTIEVYVPPNYVRGTETPFIVL